MEQELSIKEEYVNTISKLEQVKHLTANETEYWFAREIFGILGYGAFREFEAVIERAVTACKGIGVEPSHHFVFTPRMVEIGSGAKREQADFFLSRAACYLIAMNGDSGKPEIAAAQAYFTIQTRRMEQEDARSPEEKRLALRGKVTQSVKRVSKVAQDAGVRNHMQPVFHDARYQGLYGMSLKELKTKKGLKEKENLLDVAGSLELSMHDFQMNLAADVIAKEPRKGEQIAINTNKKVGEHVRSTVVTSGGTVPEYLPVEPNIKVVEKKLKASTKKITSSSNETLPPSSQ